MQVSRRVVLSGLALIQVTLTAAGRAQSDEKFMVRIRSDQAVGSLLPPVAQRDLVIEPDQSVAAHEMAERAPAERAAPVILIIVGAIAVVQILRMLNEMLHEYYYGGVIIDGRKSPPEISNDPKIPPGMVFVFQADGSVKQFEGGDLSAELLTSVLRAKK